MQSCKSYEQNLKIISTTHRDPVQRMGVMWSDCLEPDQTFCQTRQSLYSVGDFENRGNGPSSFHFPATREQARKQLFWFCIFFFIYCHPDPSNTRAENVLITVFLTAPKTLNPPHIAFMMDSLPCSHRGTPSSSCILLGTLSDNFSKNQK